MMIIAFISRCFLGVSAIIIILICLLIGFLKVFIDYFKEKEGAV
mgnify:FL=1